MRKFLVMLALTVMTAATAAAQSISGEWDATMGSPGGARNFRIVFVQDGEKLTGTVKRASGDVPLEGTIKGTQVKFSYTIIYNENPLVMTMTATVTGDEMKGSVDIASQMQDAFSAKRIPAPGKLTDPGQAGSAERTR